jgi:hypothetical protein
MHGLGRIPSMDYDMNTDVRSSRLEVPFTFKAHLDTILCAFGVDKPSGLVTVSMDGYQRIWSSAGEALGEICLPSTDQGRRMDRWEDASERRGGGGLEGGVGWQHVCAAFLI